MRAEARWRSNWRAVGPDGAIRVHLPRSRTARRTSELGLRRLPAGTSVVLVAAAPGAVRRCAAVAAQAGIVPEREYLAFPSAEAPAYLVEDEPASVRVFVQTVLAVPPRTALALPMHLAFRVLRSFGTWRLTRMVAPGRVVVGRRV